MVAFYETYKVCLQTNNWNNLFLCSLNVWSIGDSSPEAESEGDTESETGSREHMEWAQTKSESEIKASVSRDSLETDSQALSENWIKSTLSAGTERLFSLKFILLLF